MAGSAHPGNPQNATPSKTVHTRSRFPINSTFLATELFGRIGVHFATDVVRGDKLPLSSHHELRSYTLKSPFFGSIRKSKDYLFVALDAILPINADKVNTQPIKGNDIPDGVNCSIKNGPKKFYDFVKYLYDASMVQPVEQSDEITMQRNFLRFLTIASYFFSPGSLLAYTGYNLARCLHFSPRDSSKRELYLDDVFDMFMNALVIPTASNLFSFRYGEAVGGVHISNEPDFRSIWRLMLDKFHDEPAILWDSRFSVLNYSSAASDVLTDLRDNYVIGFYGPSGDSNPDTVLNFGRCASYQIACHHFMSNDKIDYIYSAELYRELIGSYVSSVISSAYGLEDFQFSWNGLKVQYDWLSGKALDWMLISGGDDSITIAEVSYFAGLFSWRHSLRYVDYFVGAKTEPIAVGDINAPVAADGVNIVDFSKTSAFAKLLNATNQLGQKAKKWLEGIFPGPEIKWDKHDPAFIGHSVDIVGAQENENTGAAQFGDSQVEGVDTAQNSVTAVFRNRSSRDFAFMYEASLPGFIIGVTYYEIPRVYSSGIDRQMMAYDRYDQFNPMMQFTGDQPIYGAEITSDVSGGTIFGYQAKDMQYKQGINRAVGGFASGMLPSWYFDDDAFYKLSKLNQEGFHINPTFIRSSSIELDKFYLSLTGWSLSTYFHFIVAYSNSMNATREMAWIPQLSL